MRLKRLEIKAEYEDTSMHVFHTPYPNYIDDPNTIVCINGEEYAGRVSFAQEGRTFTIKIEEAEDVN